tara:strand:- start:1222 stop:2091 length:870 start_codon:yes stop_codon:yes gene_type:complete
MRTIKLLILTIVITINPVSSQEKNDNNTQSLKKSNLELPRVQVIPIKDTKTNRQYELYNKLPEEYSKNNNIKYPVIYFTDAMWHIEILSGSTEYIVQEAILVGISWEKKLKGELIGTHASRFRDYSITKSSNSEHQAKYQLGQASNHLNFIRNDVIKYVEKNYRTDFNNRSYFGYSMGGKFGAYILVKQPDTFKNYILGSPSLNNNDIAYLSDIVLNTTLKPENSNSNVFISYGKLEKEVSKNIEEFITILKNDKNVHLQNVVIEGNHQTAFPMTGVRSLTWLSHLMKD